MHLKSGRRLFQRTHVDDEAVFHILLQQALVSFIDFLDGDDFDVRSNVVLTAIVEHLLSFNHAADHGAGDGSAFGNEREHVDLGRMFSLISKRASIAGSMIGGMVENEREHPPEINMFSGGCSGKPTRVM